ncbi:hypothetical protein CONPUDRAFT_33177, partial [Coniophora puteana RWD-64-598 SS2]
FWYARVLGVYHAKVFCGTSVGQKPERFEFLHVRWFGCDPEWTGGPESLQLDRIGYVPFDGHNKQASPAFGFVDPGDVLRACHLIPAFAVGKTLDLLPPSSARDSREGDWINYYVMRFVDRDMMMRYLGIGIGHSNPSGFPNE